MLTRLTPTVLAVILAFAVVSCGDDGTEPETFPDMTGAYSATFAVAMEAGDISFGDSCDGSITISDQTRGSFSGGFSIPGTGCDLGEAAGTFSGAVDTGGNVSSGDLFEELMGNPAESGCTVTSGSTTLTGRKLSNGFTLSSNTELRCDGLDAILDLDITATLQ